MANVTTATGKNWSYTGADGATLYGAQMDVKDALFKLTGQKSIKDVTARCNAAAKALAWKVSKWVTVECPDCQE